MEDTQDREMHIETTFDASIEKVWQAWTDPEQIVQWWGPNGFTNTMENFDLREGGEWRFTMHGPDGKNYGNRSVFLELIPHRIFKFEHFNPHFITRVLFEAKDNQTRIDWTMQFDTAEMRDIIVKVHKADDGLRQNIEKLEKYLAEVQR